jgi:hypothetical protein
LSLLTTLNAERAGVRFRHNKEDCDGSCYWSRAPTSPLKKVGALRTTHTPPAGLVERPGELCRNLEQPARDSAAPPLATTGLALPIARELMVRWPSLNAAGAVAQVIVGAGPALDRAARKWRGDD